MQRVGTKSNTGDARAIPKRRRRGLSRLRENNCAQEVYTAGVNAMSVLGEGWMLGRLGTKGRVITTRERRFGQEQDV